MRKSASVAGLFVAVSAMALCAGAAQAQEATTLEEIVVTAQRKTEDLQRAAAAISVRSGDDLQRQGKYSLSSILEDVPGVAGGAATANASSAGSPGGTDAAAAGLTIRGIPSNTGVGGSATSVATSAAIYVDGVYSGLGGSYDIDRVELLRGPQGTLYGRSATSGVVAIHTRNPDLNDFGGEISLEAGNYETRRYTGVVNVPLVDDKLALRVSANHYEREGFVSAEGGATSTDQVRVKLLFEPNESISLLVGAALEDNELNGGGASITLVTPDTYVVTSSPLGSGENSYRQVWAELNWDLGGLTLTYQPALRSWESEAVNRLRIPAIGLGFNQQVSTPNDDFITHELRVASAKDGRLTWQGGMMYYLNELDSLVTSRDSNSGALQFISDNHKRTKAFGAFAEATFAFADNFRVTGGLRYDNTEVQTEQIYTSNLTFGILGSNTYGLPENPSTLALTGAPGERTFNNTTYKLRAEYDITPDNLVYALTSSGFTPGDVSATTGLTGAPVAVVFDDETLVAYEIGSKNRFLDDRVQVNASAFFYEYSGYQVANVNISSIPGTSAFATLTAAAEAYGLELETLFALTENDRLGLNIAYTQAYFVDADTTPVAGTPYTFAYYFAREDIPGVVPLTVQASYDRSFELPGDARLSLRGDVRYMSEHDEGPLTAAQLAIGALPYVRTDAQIVGNLSATWLSGDGRYSVTGYVRNVGDNVYKTNVRVSDGVLPGTFSASPGLSEPRTYGIILSARM